MERFDVSWLNWSGVPDVAAVALLICAFASVAWHSRTPVSRLWLTGWLMILLHFTAALFVRMPGIWSSVAFAILSAALIWAGLLYMHSTIPYREDRSAYWMFGLLFAANTLYVAILSAGPADSWALKPAAVLLGLCPLGVTLSAIRRVNHPQRWVITLLYVSLAIFLLLFQNRPENGVDLAWNALMFTVYLGCCIFIFAAYHRATAGAFVTITGFFSWAMVFVVAPLLNTFLPHIHIQNEVWNLPKFVVAVGMMLLLLEDQIEHNKHLALHDALTGLANRRLFEDRMTSAIERCRRTRSEMALLVIDLDGFKDVNDTMGHHTGDLVLQRVAQIFNDRVRRSDTVSRTGGDEFSIILEEPTSRNEAEYVGKSLRQLIEKPLDVGGYQVHISASIGIAVFPQDAVDAESLCIAADLQMYGAKREASHSSQGTGTAKGFIPGPQTKTREVMRMAEESIPPGSEA
ncbi:MAG: diguanylate cyclase domain-containing protein [Terracidiphilus sp.]